MTRFSVNRRSLLMGAAATAVAVGNASARSLPPVPQAAIGTDAGYGRPCAVSIASLRR